MNENTQGSAKIANKIFMYINSGELTFLKWIPRIVILEREKCYMASYFPRILMYNGLD